MSDDLRIEPMTAADADDVLRIYGEGIATGIATFDTKVPDWRRWHAVHRRECRLVARLNGAVVGWTALSNYSARDVYAGVAWESVYVAESARGRGVGATLLRELIPLTERHGIWTLIAGVQAENEASLRLHERAGFRRIGVQERVGQDAAGRWCDVVLLERRSVTVGRD
jgi:phosphinothricin acetyltransferase